MSVLNKFCLKGKNALIYTSIYTEKKLLQASAGAKLWFCRGCRSSQVVEDKLNSSRYP